MHTGSFTSSLKGRVIEHHLKQDIIFSDEDFEGLLNSVNWKDPRNELPQWSVWKSLDGLMEIRIEISGTPNYFKFFTCTA
jgi:hypothetical protein